MAVSPVELKRVLWQTINYFFSSGGESSSWRIGCSLAGRGFIILFSTAGSSLRIAQYFMPMGGELICTERADQRTTEELSTGTSYIITTLVFERPQIKFCMIKPTSACQLQIFLEEIKVERQSTAYIMS